MSEQDIERDAIALRKKYEALKAENAALKEENANLTQHLEKGEQMYIAMRNRCASVEAENARLSAPVSDDEWHNVTVFNLTHDPRTWKERSEVDAIIAARTTPAKEQE